MIRERRVAAGLGCVGWRGAAGGSFAGGRCGPGAAGAGRRRGGGRFEDRGQGVLVARTSAGGDDHVGGDGWCLHPWWLVAVAIIPAMLLSRRSSDGRIGDRLGGDGWRPRQ